MPVERPAPLCLSDADTSESGEDIEIVGKSSLLALVWMFTEKIHVTK